MAASAEMTRRVAERWFGALKAGNGQEALACLDPNIVWINNPAEKGLSDIIPWLGEYHGLDAVIGTFVIWGRLSAVKRFELVQLNINGDEAMAIVHEVAEIKATGLNYDIEFIQRFRVADDKIVFWKSYWDTVKGIVPFRGDMAARLLEAARTGDVDEAMLVLPFGVDPNVRDETTGQTALMIAAGRGHLAVVQQLLAHHADPNALETRAGTSSLHKACQGGHFDIAKALVEAGALIDLQATTTGHTPIVEAIWFKSADIVEYLLDKNARIELKTYYGFTIDQHIAYAKNVNSGAAAKRALARIERLVADRRARDAQAQQEQALNLAAQTGDLQALRAALAAGQVALEQRWPIVGSFDDGHTPLLIASRNGHVDLVRELVAAGADVNAIEPVFGAVPLHKATYNGHIEITKLLATAKGVHLDHQGPSNGYTPLHDALWHAKAECASILLDAGGATTIVAYDGKLPIDIAREELGATHPIVSRLASASGATI